MYKFTHNGVTYTHSPYIPTIEGFDEEGQHIFGDSLKEKLNLTDEQAEAYHQEGLKNIIRKERDIRLAETDWSAGEDVPQALKDKYKVYRQALRDITKDVTLEETDGIEIKGFAWPEKPS